MSKRSQGIKEAINDIGGVSQYDKIIVENLLRLLTDRNLTEQKLADYIGCGKTHINDILNLRTSIRMAELEMISKNTNISIFWFLHDSKTPEAQEYYMRDTLVKLNINPQKAEAFADFLVETDTKFNSFKNKSN